RRSRWARAYCTDRKEFPDARRRWPRQPDGTHAEPPRPYRPDRDPDRIAARPSGEAARARAAGEQPDRRPAGRRSGLAAAVASRSHAPGAAPLGGPTGAPAEAPPGARRRRGPRDHAGPSGPVAADAAAAGSGAEQARADSGGMGADA